MHGYILLRGIKHEQELTIKFLETQMLKWNTVNNLSNERQSQEIQHALRPIQLFECVFPEENLPTWMAMLNIQTDDKYGKLSFASPMNVMRKMLGAEKFPKMDYSKLKNIPYIPRRGVAIHPIGMKKDERRIVDGKSYQEAL